MKNLEKLSGDNWKIDIIMVSRIPVMLIIHEYTLYTLTRRKAQFKTISSVIDEISAHCPWYTIPENPVIGKNNDRRLNGSITEIKRISAGDYPDNLTKEIAERINTCIYSYLSEKNTGTGHLKKLLENICWACGRRIILH